MTLQTSSKGVGEHEGGNIYEFLDTTLNDKRPTKEVNQTLERLPSLEPKLETKTSLVSSKRLTPFQSGTTEVPETSVSNHLPEYIGQVIVFYLIESRINEVTQLSS